MTKVNIARDLAQWATTKLRHCIINFVYILIGDDQIQNRSYPNNVCWMGSSFWCPKEASADDIFFFPAKKTKVYFLSPDLVKTLKISICLKFSVVLILSRRRRPVGSRDKCKQLSIVKRVAFCSLLVQLLAPLKSVWDCQDRDDLHQVLLCVKFQFGQ